MKDLKELANSLGITIEEAQALVEDDKEVDRMNSISEIDGDLTEDQKKECKAARKSDRKPTNYKLDSTKSKKKEKPTNKMLIDEFKALVEGLGADGIEVLNDQREFTFNLDNTKFKIVLSNPRK